jgi:hypothetical protein
VIGDFGGVVDCKDEREGVGTLRRLTHADGTLRPSSAWQRWTKRPSG